MDPLHIALICESWPATMGNDAGPFTLAQELANRGHRVSILCNGVPPIESSGRLEVHTHIPTSHFKPKRLRDFLRWQVKARACIRADVVIATTSVVASDLLVCFHGTYQQLDRMDSIAGAAFVSDAVERMRCGLMLGYTHKRIELERIQQGKIRSAIALNAVIEEGLQQLMPADAGVIHRVDLPLPRVDRQGESLQDQRALMGRAWGLGPQTPWIVYSPGVQGDRHGFEWMMLGYRAYIQQGGQGVLLLTGGPRYTQLEWIAQLGLRDRVVCVGYLEDAPRFYALADLFISPADLDPGGWGVRQALATGRKVITTSGCGAADLVRASGGVVMDVPVNPDQLAGMLIEHTRNPIGVQHGGPESLQAGR